MLRKRVTRRSTVLVIGVIAGGIFTGGVVGAQFRAAPSEDLEASLRDDPLVQVADIPAAHGHGGRGVFVQPTSAGFLCLWDAPSATALSRQGGCNPADDPLGGNKLRVSFAYDGGPAIRDVKDARLIGLATIDVASIQLVMTDGTRRDVAMKRTPAVSGLQGSYRAFGYRLKPSDLRQGVGPTVVLALDSAGKEIERQPTGFVE